MDTIFRNINDNAMKGYEDHEIVLLLTATVTPQFGYMANNKVEERFKQYLEAINFYLENFPYKVVVGENSGCKDLANNIDKKYYNRFELITYVETDSSRCYGYNEMVILETCKNQSLFLKRAELIIKITGRIKVLNLEQLISQVRKPRGDFFATEIGVQLLYNNARCFFFTKSVWDEIIALKEGVGGITVAEVNAGKIPPHGVYVDVETAYAALIRKRIHKDKKTFKMLRYPLILSGSSGYFGTTLDLHTREILLKYIKCFLKYLYWRVIVLPRIK